MPVSRGAGGPQARERGQQALKGSKGSLPTWLAIGAVVGRGAVPGAALLLLLLGRVVVAGGRRPPLVGAPVRQGQPTALGALRAQRWELILLQQRTCLAQGTSWRLLLSPRNSITV